MIMSAKRLDLLLKVAGRQRNDAARKMSAHHQVLGQQEQRLNELRRYVTDYRSAGMPNSPTMIANREQFLGRLRQAESQQVNAVEDARRAAGQSTRLWLDRRVNERKFETLHGSALDRECLIQGRSEQKQEDEFASRRHRGLSAASEQDS